ncbi:MAG: S41 family peptidase [Bernardetiaceae bacterium]|nr:S41 family peptidase [Bernardetiaceae bacterium]
MFGWPTWMAAQPKPAYHPANQLPPAALQADLDLFQRILYRHHPGIFRYQTQDSLDRRFTQAKAQLNRPHTDREYRVLINKLVDGIGCGHTEIVAPEALQKYRRKHRPSLIPIAVAFLNNKLWLTANGSSDTTLILGSEILAVDSLPVYKIVTDIYRINTSDGYNRSHKRVAVGRYFAHDYAYLYGERKTNTIVVRDSTGKVTQHLLRPRLPKPAAKKTKAGSQPPRQLASQNSPKFVLQQPTRRLQLRDSGVAVLDIDAFTGKGYKKFYRRVFRTLAEKKVQHLVIDLRNNGGGKIPQTNFLLQHLLDTEFAHSYRKVRHAPDYLKYTDGAFAIRLGLASFENMPTRRPRKGLFGKTKHQKLLTDSGRVYKFFYQPQKRHHFNGQVLVLTNGGTFSAASQAAAYLRHLRLQVRVIGEETGGGEMGCNANMLPWITLPETKIRFRLPLYRVQHELPLADRGRGVMPDVPVLPSVADILKQRDAALEKALELMGRGQSVGLRLPSAHSGFYWGGDFPE